MYNVQKYTHTQNLVTAREMCKQLGISFEKLVKASQVVQWHVINTYYKNRCHKQ